LICPSGTCQQTSMSYDGFGRLKNRHSAEQDDNATTIWDYNPDDTVESVTDARGATCTYGYNNRHQVSSATHTLSGQTTIALSYGYDAAGNRTSMTDSAGSTSYSYNQLSQLMSETRTFNGLGSYSLTYDYNLAGELKKITDPTNTTINYTYDTAGRLGNVTGSDNLYGAVTEYASGLAYRAWGGIKGLTYGNNYTLGVSYNSRLQGTQFEVAGRPPQFGASTVMKTQFDYYPDGAMKYAHDLLDERFDRAFSYDHVAMLKEAYSGSESRDFVNGTNSGTATGAYRQSFQHDAFGNMTHRDNRFWSQSDSFNASYTNSRRQGFSYDAAGNLLADSDLVYTYDAAGNNVSIVSGANSRTISVVYDGNGTVVKRSELQQNTLSSVAYYLRSSVLDGRIVTELNQSGQKVKGYVFAEGELLAEQANDLVRWQHENPLTGSQGSSGSDGYFNADAEPDPMGINVGFEDPYINCCTLPEPNDQIMPMLLGSFSSGRCSLDGMSIDCGWAMEMLESGSAVQCPNNDCGPRSVVYQGQRTWAFFNAYGDGYQGFVPLGARYIGNGGIAPIGSGGFPTLGHAGSWPDTRGDTNLGLLNGARHPEEDLGRTTQTFFNHPQNTSRTPLTSREVDNLLSDLKNLLGNEDCASFIQSALEQLKTDTGRSQHGTTDILKLFDAVKAGNGFDYRTMKDAQARGGGGPGYASISINANLSWSRMSSGARGLIIIHELFHVAGYGHEAMARATYNMGESFDKSWKAWNGEFPDPNDPLFQGPKGNAELDGAYSGFFKNVLDQHCK
ncbi:MAG: hypothetical protein ABR501_01900, partial [Pyrinomonadaceae bacterium]